MKKNAGKARTRIDPVQAGVVGMGLMGTSIAACLLAAGHPVAGVTRTASKLQSVRRRLRRLLDEMKRERIFRGDPARAVARFTIAQDYAVLEGCDVVVESIVEDIAAKRDALAAIEEAVPSAAIIGSNTSAIPVTEIQRGARHPRRVVGLHWAEPAHVTRFMEVVCGERTAAPVARRAMTLAESWGKEPTLVRRDVRGFITNRLMYAMMREAFHLVETRVGTIEDIDRSFRNDIGYWATLAGPFRWMDLTGIPAYAAVMRDLFPDLANSPEVPALMHRVAGSGALGIANARGFYRYTPAEAARWERKFLRFTYDIRALARKYR